MAFIKMILVKITLAANPYTFDSKAISRSGSGIKLEVLTFFYRLKLQKKLNLKHLL